MQTMVVFQVIGTQQTRSYVKILIKISIMKITKGQKRFMEILTRLLYYIPSALVHLE